MVHFGPTAMRCHLQMDKGMQKILTFCATAMAELFRHFAKYVSLGVFIMKRLLYLVNIA